MKQLIERLRSDAEHHRQVAADCDCRPEDTINWQHALNCEEAAHFIESATSGVHRSDCATNNAPALPVGGCDCGANIHARRRLGARLAELLDDDHWAECEALLLAAGVTPNATVSRPREGS